MPKSLPQPKVHPLDPHNTCCPNPACSNRGQVGRGNITIHSQRERRYWCKTCRKSFAATTGTVFYRAHTAQSLLTQMVILLACGCPVQAIVAAFGFDERTVAQWAQKAGAHCERVDTHLVEAGQVPGRVVQADELWVKLVGHKVWQAMAMAVESRLWLGGVMSATRDLPLITALVLRVHRSMARRDLTVCVDGLASYVTAFLDVFRRKVQPTTKRRGAWRKVVEVGLRIGQVVKRYTGKRVAEVDERGIRGSVAAIRRRLQQAGAGHHIHTAYIERLNATFRAHWAGLTRRGRAIAHLDQMARAGMWLVGTCYNLCWPHASLRYAAPEGAAQKWQQCTPAMAARLTDHIWSMDELFRYTVPLPPWVPPKRRGRKPKPKPEGAPPRRQRQRQSPVSKPKKKRGEADHD